MGNKTDKLSALQLRELEAACSEHLLISAVATDNRCLKQIEAFFIEVSFFSILAMYNNDTYLHDVQEIINL